MNESTGDELQLHEIQREQDIADAWKHDLSRIVRRDQISRSLGEKTPLKDIKDTVRSYEEQMGVQEMIEGLIENEFSIDSKTEEILNNVNNEITSKHPEVDGVIILGSAVHGGGAVRNMLETGDESDLDWGLVMNKWETLLTTKGNKEEEHKLIQKIMKTTDEVISELKSEGKVDANYHQCSFVNPIDFRVPQLSSVEDVQKIIEDSEQVGIGEITRVAAVLILYFEPSIPPELNIENRKFVLEALKELSVKDQQEWEALIEDVSREWEESHRVKWKHVRSRHDDTERSKNLQGNVVRQSRDVMGKLMKAVLQGTNQVKTEPEFA